MNVLVNDLSNSNPILCFRFFLFSYWQPGPEDMMYKLKYSLFGFVLLQDMVDRGITEVLTNETIEEPGLFLQMMPYPCYIYDQ